MLLYLSPFRLLPSIYRILRRILRWSTISISVWLIWIPFISVCFKRTCVLNGSRYKWLNSSKIWNFLILKHQYFICILQWCLLEHPVCRKVYCKWQNNIFLLYGKAPTILALFFVISGFSAKTRKSIKDTCHIHEVMWTLFKFAHHWFNA